MFLLLDNRTLTVVQVAVSAILCLIMLIAWRTQKTYPGFLRWTWSKVPHALGFLLVSLRGLVPDWVSILLANVLLFTSPILLYEGIRQFRQQPHRAWLHYALMVLLIGGFCYFTWVHPNVPARIILLTGFSAFILLRCAHELCWRVPPALRPSYWFTATMFGLYSLMLLLRMLTAGSLPHLHDPFIHDRIQSLMFLATIIMPIAWTFGFFMMTNARLTLELQLVEAELRDLASTDFLTGAMNRRAFYEQGERELARSQRNGAPVSIVMCDIDHFKLINDQYGHDTGDQYLRAMVDTFREHLRKSDLLARWGGEEFAILLPETDVSGARLIAERLRYAVEQLAVPPSKGDAHATISLGCAHGDADHELDAIIHRADVALYHAKTQGRNRVNDYSEESESVV